MTELNDFHTVQEHNSLKDSINKLGEKVSHLGSRQDGIESQMEKILLALEHNGATEEASRVQQEKMAHSIEKLSEVLGNIQIQMARNEATAMKMMDEKLEDVYAKINSNKDEFRNYTTTNMLYKQVGAIYALVVIIAVMAWTNFNENKSDVRLKFADTNNQHTRMIDNVKVALKDRSDSCESRLQNLENKARSAP